MTMRNIVCTAAHPDDIEYGMGGTAWLLKDSYKLHFICATKGECGIKGKSMDEAAAIREKEQAAACEMLDAELTFLGQIDGGGVFAGPDVCELIAEKFRQLEPAAVFTLWPINVADHFMAAAATMKALCMAKQYFTSELYFYETGIGGQNNQFDPDLHVNISDVIEKKKALLRCHASQFQTEEKIEGVVAKQNQMFRGKLARCEYAEPFKTALPLIDTRWGRKAGSLLLDGF